MDHRLFAGNPHRTSPVPGFAAAGGGRRPADAAALSGQRIGRFHIYRTIGSGGTSIVYQAFDTVENRAIALKVMHPHSDAAARRRFQIETQIASRLQHPHIVQTYQVGLFTEYDVGYIAMELVFGDTLADLLREVHQLNFAEACCFLAPIAEALDYAHREKLVHRDVKPSNILIRPSTVLDEHHILIASLDYPLVPLLTDFGIAWALDMPEITVAGRTVGSPVYMAPEQCSGAAPVDSRADIYALGLILYRCIVGKDLFTGTTAEILYKHVHLEFDVQSHDLQLVTVPQALLDLLQACLAKSPAERLQSTRELAQRLTDIGYGAEIGPSGWTERGDPEAATRTMPKLDALPWSLPTRDSRIAQFFRGRRRRWFPRPPAGATLSTILVFLVLAAASLLLVRSQSASSLYSVSPPDTARNSADQAAESPVAASEHGADEPSPPTPELPHIAAAPVLPRATPVLAPYAVVNAAEGINVRAGPGVGFPVLALMPNRELLSITGTDASRGWWEVDLSEHLNQTGLRGWISDDFVLTRNADAVIPLDPALAPAGTPVPAASAGDAAQASPASTAVPDSYLTLCRDFGLYAGFEEVFREFDALADFGCQTSIPTWGTILMQPFQWGDIFFMLQSRRVYVTFLLDDSTERRPRQTGADTGFFRYPAWDLFYVSPAEFNPPASDPGIAPGQEVPVADLNFFASLLNLVDERTANVNLSLRSRLGTPLGPPERAAVVVQTFERGFMLLVTPREEAAFILQLGKLQRIDIQ